MYAPIYVKSDVKLQLLLSKGMLMTTILIIVVVVLLLGGGGWGYGRRNR